MSTKNISKFPTNGRNNQSGVVAVEYALALLAVVLVSLTAVAQLRGKTDDFYRNNINPEPFNQREKNLLVSN